MFIIGVLSITFHNHLNHKSHYSLFLNETKSEKIQLHIFEELKPTKLYRKYLAKVVALNANKTTGLLCVNVDSTINITVDDFIYANSNLIKFRKPLNPYQFDYGLHMSKRNIYHQVYLSKSNTLKLSVCSSIYGSANRIRKRVNNTLIDYDISQKHISIINALFLGQRQMISNDTYKSFTNSGTIHILAISGLHIGLLMLLLGVLLKPLKLFKIGKNLLPFVLIILLWSYAFLTGMSSSVVRSVTMFSLISIAIYSNRVANTFHVLIISLFLLLMYDPLYIFDVGFQLSYLAVFAIVWIKPLFGKIWTPKYYISRKIWDIFSITLAVQFGVLPLSLFYFHQFPGSFFISNMIIIPLLGFLLFIGLLSLLGAYFGWIPNTLLDFLEYSLSLLLNFVEFISSKDMFVFSNISFNSVNLICWYLFIVCLIITIKSFSYKRLMFSFFAIIFLQLGYIYNKKENSSSEFIIFNQYKSTLLAHRQGNKLVYSSDSSKLPKSIGTYGVNNFVTSIRSDSLKNIYMFKEYKILVVDEKAVYDLSFKPDIILLSGSPKVNLNRLIVLTNPKLIIADNNNYKSYVNRWRLTCLEESQSFYSITENGAFVLK
jgi:competence protein ComEC